MNAQVDPVQPAPAAGVEADRLAYASVTIWSSNHYFLQVHYGNFNSWEEAEDFATIGRLSLEERSNALFLVGPHGAAFIPDQSMQIYRHFENGFAGIGTYDMTFDDLLEVASMGEMRLSAIGSQPVTRGRPVVARHMNQLEFQTVAANDE